MQQEWIAVCTLVESDPHQAREWYYGMDPSNNCSSLTPAAPVVWKRLALHVACMVGAPLQVMKALIRAHPAALQLSDPHSGAAPLHLACGLGADISTLQLLLVPGATKVTDARGRMPIHHAMIAQAPYGIVEWLIRCDPASVLCPDREGKTPLQLAHQSYPAGSSVLGLLELVWM